MRLLWQARALVALYSISPVTWLFFFSSNLLYNDTELHSGVQGSFIKGVYQYSFALSP